MDTGGSEQEPDLNIGGSEQEPDHLTSTTRRGVLYSTVAAAGMLAGCESDNEGVDTDTTTDDSPGPTPDSTVADPTPTDSTPADTAADTTPTDSTPVDTAADTTQPARSPSGGGSFDVSTLNSSPSSAFAPTDGFGSVAWLGETDPEVITVTNLEASGEGSFPWALRRSGPRIVVFDAGGVIDLAGENLVIGNGNLYVAGQTAPSPGITVIRGGIFSGGTNTLIQHIRIRPGDRLGGEINGTPSGSPTDALSVENDTPNVIFDHCSVSWGTDENMSASGGEGNYDITFSNNLIAECLSRSLHEEGEHSKGTLINDLATDTAVIGNTYVHHTDRHPRIKGGSSCAAVNNYVYNFHEAIEMGGGSRTALGSIVGNYFEGGPATDPSVPLIIAEGQGGARAYVDNNLGSADHREYERDLGVMSLKSIWPDGLTAMDATNVREHNLSTAGARPADRTPHDQRIISHAREGTGERIDSQTEVGGYPDLASTERSLNPPAPGDGLAEWLYQYTRAVELPDAEPP